MTWGVGLIIGVIIGVLGPFLASFARDWYLRPKLIIGTDEPHEGENYVNHSIRITNQGRTVAKSCTALLTIANMEKEDVVDPRNGHAYIVPGQYRGIRDESLCWSLQTHHPSGGVTNPAFLSVLPGASRLVELCGVYRQSLDIEIPSEMGWMIRRVVLRGNKEYEVELKLFAENVHHDPKKHKRKFKLIPTSEKKDIVVERLGRECWCPDLMPSRLCSRWIGWLK